MARGLEMFGYFEYVEIHVILYLARCIFEIRHVYRTQVSYNACWVIVYFGISPRLVQKPHQEQKERPRLEEMFINFYTFREKSVFQN